MKKKISKNQVVIATLAVLIAVAGYISYDKTGISLKPSIKEANEDEEKDDRRTCLLQDGSRRRLERLYAHYGQLSAAECSTHPVQQPAGKMSLLHRQWRF